MKSSKKTPLDFVIDKLKNSIENATHFRGLRMFIDTNAALRLISQYFKS